MHHYSCCYSCYIFISIRIIYHYGSGKRTFRAGICFLQAISIDGGFREPTRTKGEEGGTGCGRGFKIGLFVVFLSPSLLVLCSSVLAEYPR